MAQTVGDLSVGEQGACILDADGRQRCLGGSNRPDILSAGRFLSVSIAPFDATCGLKTDGSALCWGLSYPDPDTVAAPGPWRKVVAGSEFGCGIRTDGRLQCWGLGAPAALRDQPSADTYRELAAGYGGNADHDGLTNGCSTIGISKTTPVEVTEQYYPVLFRRFGMHEGSGGAGLHRGGFGVHYEVEILRGEARASFVMDHGRFGPPGVQGGKDGGRNVVRIHRGRDVLIPEHLSKDQDIPLQPGDRVEVLTPGGGGYGDPLRRDAGLVSRDVSRGYYTAEQARTLFGVVLAADGGVDQAATAALRKGAA